MIQPQLVRSLRFLTILTISACGSAAPVAQSPSTVDPNIATRATERTQLQSRMRIVFGWTLQDRDARFSGDGVTRVEPPYRARLDLFGPRGEGYLSAAMVDFDLRMPPGAPADLLPPPTMLWSVLGVFRAPVGAQLIATQGDSAKMELQYRAGEETWTFTLANWRLMHAEWQGPQQGRQTVEIKGYHTRGVPDRVVYRDWRAFRELTLTLTQVNDVASFPPDTWTPGR
jgi:hypothetical protein